MPKKHVVYSIASTLPENHPKRGRNWERSHSVTERFKKSMKWVFLSPFKEDLSFGSHDSMQPLQGVMHRGGTPSQVGGKPTHPSCQLQPAQAMEKGCGNGGLQHSQW